MLAEREEPETGLEPDETVAAQLNVAQIIQGRLFALISDISVIDMEIRFDALMEADLKEFYSHLLLLYTAARKTVSLDTQEKLNAFFKDRTKIKGDAGMGKMAEEGLGLALLLQDELEAQGFWQIFDPVEDPPFVGDVI